MKKLLLVYLLFQLSYLINAQEYKFNSFGQEEGLTDLFINTLDQAENGYLMVGTS